MIYSMIWLRLFSGLIRQGKVVAAEELDARIYGNAKCQLFWYM